MRYTQPQSGPLRVDRGNQLGATLNNFVVFNSARAFDAVTGIGLTPSATVPASVVTPYGLALQGMESATTYTDLPIVGTTGAGFETLLFGLIRDTDPTLQERIIDSSIVDNSGYLSTIAAGAYSIAPPRSIVSGAFGIAGVAKGQIEHHCLVINYGATWSVGANVSTIWYVNGVPFTITIIANGDGTALEPNGLRFLGILAASRGFAGKILYFGRSPSQWSGDMASRFTANPWQVIASPRRILRAAAAGAPTLSAATMYGITSTGGYPRVTRA